MAHASPGEPASPSSSTAAADDAAGGMARREKVERDLAGLVEVREHAKSWGAGPRSGTSRARRRGEDGTAYVWSTALDDMLHQLCIGPGRNLSLNEWHRYLGDLPWKPTCENWTPKNASQ